MPRKGEYRPRRTPLAGVMGKFPVGCVVHFRGDPIGVVVGYDREPEEPEVVFRYLDDPGKRSQFPVRSCEYRRAPEGRPYTRDLDRDQFLAISSLESLHPSVTLRMGTSASGDRLYSISGEERAVLHAILGIEREGACAGIPAESPADAV